MNQSKNLTVEERRRYWRDVPADTIRIEREPLLRVLGEHGERWIQGSWENMSGESCLHGAIRRCQEVPGDAYLIQHVAERQGWGTAWNDARATRWSDIEARIDGGIEVTDADLADTYGPQWREVVALVRRAAVLTREEADRLATALADDLADAWAAATAQADAWPAAVASGDAARAASEAAAWASGVAAEAAAVALSTRHLIGQGQFTRSHYDLMTAAWREVIGPVHPED